MTQITIDKNILLVEVPEDANGFGVSQVPNNWDCFAYYAGEPSFGSSRMITLPPGSWQFIGTTDEVSEAIAQKCFPNYGGAHSIKNFQYQMKRNNVPTDKRFAILLKLNP